MVSRPFAQVDVFTETTYLGNPVAVVLDADGVTTEEMQRVARWTNLSETTFVLTPTVPGADYQVRIFTPTTELPFAGHPTLGTCHAWLNHDPPWPAPDRIVQQCAGGLISIRRMGYGLAFAAPPLLRQGPVEADTFDHLASVLGLNRTEILDAQWVDNGPGWLGVLVRDADVVRGLRPALAGGAIGVIGPHSDGSPYAFEVRAFLSSNGATFEDPVTGSLNASLAQWLIATHRAQPPYVVSQGGVIGAAGRVHIETDVDGRVWVGGGTLTAIVGRIDVGGSVS
jgi:PhzF family phenazine biosynthesis protein